MLNLVNQILKSWDLPGGFKVCYIDKFPPAINDLVRKYFDGTYSILRWRNHLNDEQLQSLQSLNENQTHRKRIDIGVFKDNDLAAWSYGWQAGLESANYYMANSCVLPEYRRAGLYSHMLAKVVQISKELGFQTISSRHVVANNPIILAKLKYGFRITGMELSEIHGNLLNLTYFNNKLREESYEVRSGFKKPNSQAIKDLFS
jgi:ribosomal protein S18 acetylase RimI-like enzyme